MAQQQTIKRSTLNGLIADYSLSNPELVEETLAEIRARKLTVLEGQ